jgi:hypothetical protein
MLLYFIPLTLLERLSQPGRHMPSSDQNKRSTSSYSLLKSQPAHRTTPYHSCTFFSLSDMPCICSECPFRTHDNKCYRVCIHHKVDNFVGQGRISEVRCICILSRLLACVTFASEATLCSFLESRTEDGPLCTLKARCKWLLDRDSILKAS